MIEGNFNKLPLTLNLGNILRTTMKHIFNQSRVYNNKYFLNIHMITLTTDSSFRYKNPFKHFS